MTFFDVALDWVLDVHELADLQTRRRRHTNQLLARELAHARMLSRNIHVHRHDLHVKLHVPVYVRGTCIYIMYLYVQYMQTNCQDS